MKILVLGGTKFLGRATVEAALERGHDVTLFNRGETNPELFPEVEKIRGDRTEDLSPLESGSWDAAIDPSGYFPHVVRHSAEALAGSVGRYLFVSSVSVYSDLSEGPSEDSPRAELGDQPIDEMLPEYENYGALKALCEDAVWEVYGDRATIVRPGLIVGPHDPTGRFTYWPHRAARGGEMVVPAPPERTVQFVDVRDLGRWLVELLERDEGGAFNATRSAVSWQELIDSARSVAGSDATPVWIPDEFLAEHEVGEWMELPMWLADPEWVGMNQAEVSRAEAAGLSHRPLEDTIRGTLDEAETTDEAGMKPERERELLEAWRADAGRDSSCWRPSCSPRRRLPSRPCSIEAAEGLRADPVYVHPGTDALTGPKPTGFGTRSTSAGPRRSSIAILPPSARRGGRLHHAGGLELGRRSSASRASTPSWSATSSARSATIPRAAQAASLATRAFQTPQPGQGVAAVLSDFVERVGEPVRSGRVPARARAAVASPPGCWSVGGADRGASSEFRAIGGGSQRERELGEVKAVAREDLVALADDVVGLDEQVEAHPEAKAAYLRGNGGVPAGRRCVRPRAIARKTSHASPRPRRFALRDG